MKFLYNLYAAFMLNFVIFVMSTHAFTAGGAPRSKEMNAMVVREIGVRKAESVVESRLERRKVFWTGSLIVSATLGTVAGLCGIVLGTVSFLGLGAQIKGISSLTTALIVIAFPLLIGAAHCLDRLDDIEREIRIEYCRSHAFEDDCGR